MILNEFSAWLHNQQFQMISKTYTYIWINTHRASARVRASLMPVAVRFHCMCSMWCHLPTFIVMWLKFLAERKY